MAREMEREIDGEKVAKSRERVPQARDQSEHHQREQQRASEMSLQPLCYVAVVGLTTYPCGGQEHPDQEAELDGVVKGYPDD